MTSEFTIFLIAGLFSLGAVLLFLWLIWYLQGRKKEPKVAIWLGAQMNGALSKMPDDKFRLGKSITLTFAVAIFFAMATTLEEAVIWLLIGYLLSLFAISFSSNV